MKRIITLFIFGIGIQTGQAFTHPGCLSTQADLDRMKAKVAAGVHPWKGSWDRLVANSHAQLNYRPNPQEAICAGGVCTRETYMTMAHDTAAAYQCALRYHISGDKRYADKAVQIMNAWSSTLKRFTGDSNAGLRAGLYGYQFACAAELMRDYSDWSTVDFARFKTMMLIIFYPINSDFLIRHNNTCDSHYWANWDLAAVASVMAIGVLCDDQAIFDEAMDYVLFGPGEGALDNAVHYLHPGGLGQWQESGRDQGHNTLGPVLMGPICEIAWNQGVDLYGYDNHRFLAGCEYIAQYNLGHEVPYVTYINCEYVVQPDISPGSRGNLRAGWDMIYHHYVNRMGLAAPYTQQYADMVRPEGGGGDYGGNSGGFDALGFTTLTHTLDPINAGAPPRGLRPYVNGRQITLSWWGSPEATGYIVKRATTSGGPYPPLAAVVRGKTHYIDPGLTPGTTYYYAVSATYPDGASLDSNAVPATADGQLVGTVIGTGGSWNNAGATKDTVFDGSLKNFFDAPSGSAWVGLDLGEGVSAEIMEVKYCPRPGYTGRMVSGKFEGANSIDFGRSATTLYTIGSQPIEGVLTAKTISSGQSFRYLRYLCPPDGHGNVSEIQFLGHVSGLNVPAIPDGVSAERINGFQISVAWNAVADATHYRVKRATVSGGPYVIMASVTDLNLTDTGLADDTTYDYVVSALNSAGESADSAEISVTTGSAGPSLR